MHEYFALIDEAQTMPDRLWPAEEHADILYKRLVHYNCIQWTYAEVLAIIIDWDTRPDPQGIVRIAYKVGAAKGTAS